MFLKFWPFNSENLPEAYVVQLGNALSPLEPALYELSYQYLFPFIPSFENLGQNNFLELSTFSINANPQKLGLSLPSANTFWILPLMINSVEPPLSPNAINS